MTIPTEPVDVPPLVLDLAGDDVLTCVWVNGLGGQTFRATPSAPAPGPSRVTLAEGQRGVRYIKYGPRNDETSFAAEAERLAWAAPYATVPRVLEVGGDATHEWLVTAEVPGRSAVDPYWVARPAAAVRGLGRGLRALHDALPVAECPFEWPVAWRIANAEQRGLAVPDELREAPPVDLAVVCHGDACAPNTLLGDDGEPSAHVDLGALGVSDRWADIAVIALSTEWNYGPGWQRALVEAYGVAWDAERIAYYQRLWEAM